MSQTAVIHGFYTHQDNIYAVGVDQTFQDDARKATAVVFSLINQNDRARAEVREWSREGGETVATTAYVISAVTLDTLTDPWFWLAIRPHHIGGVNGGCCGSGGCCSCTNLSCSGGSGNSDACIAILLICAIGLLVAALAAAVGLTASHGADAEKARQGVSEIKDMMREGQDRRVHNIFNRILTRQRAEWSSQSVKTTFTAVATGGVALLTASACIALYAVLSGNPVSPYASLLAIYGSVAIGFSLAGHSIRAITIQFNKSRDLRILHELFHEVNHLGSPHPYSILALQNVQNGTLVFGEYRYIKEGTHFSRVRASEEGNFERYPQFMLPYTPAHEN